MRGLVMIKKIEIYHFGKWQEQTFDLTDSFSIFFGNNEAGKTTLQAFIEGILFDFLDGRSKKATYQEKKNEKIGGRLLIDFPTISDVWVERVKTSGPSELKISDQLGNPLPERLLTDFLKGMSREDYQQIFGFNQEQLHNATLVAAKDLNRFFVSLGESGSEKLLQIAENAEKQAKANYSARSKKRPLSNMLLQLNDAKERLDQAKADQLDYFELKKSEKKFEEKRDKLRETVMTKQAKLRSLQTLLDKVAAYQSLKKIEQEIKELPHPFEEEDMAKIAQYRNDYELISSRLADYQKEYDSNCLSEKEEASLKTFEAHHSDVETFLHDKDAVRESLVTVEHLKKEKVTILKELERYSGQYQLDEVASVPQPLTPAEQTSLKADYDQERELRNEAKNLASKKDSFIAERLLLDKQEEELQQKMATMTDEATKKVADQAASSQGEKLSGKSGRGNSNQKSGANFGIVVMAGLLLTAILAFLNGPTDLMTIVALIGTIVAGVAIFVSSQRSSQSPDAKSDVPVNDGISVTPSPLEKEQSELSSQVSYNKKRLEEITTELERVREALAALVTERETWVKESRFHTLTNDWHVVYDTLGFKQASVLSEQLAVIEEKLEDHQERLADFTNKGVAIKKAVLLTKNDSGLTSLINQLEQWLLQGERLVEVAAEKALKAKNAQDKVHSLKAQLHTLEEQLEQWLAQAEVANYEELLEVTEKEAYRATRLEVRDQLRKTLGESYELLEKTKDLQGMTETVEVLKAEEATESLELETVGQDLATVKAHLSRLMSEETYEKELAAFTKQKQDVLQEMISWSKDKLIAAWLNHTLEDTLAGSLDYVIERAGEYFKQLTAGRYTKITLSGNNITCKRKDDQLIKLVDLSTGTLEQLYLAVRLAFVVQTKNMIQLPILIDDAMVHFDPNRRLIAYQLLASIAKETQCLLFTFDPLIYKLNQDDLTIYELEADGIE